ncbi:MAG: hypothetical protein ABSF54_06205 [Bryobacteraceae bacterium]
MNRILGLDDSPQNSSHARFRDGPGFQSATRHESTADSGEHDRIEHGAEIFVIRTIDENGGCPIECERTLAKVLASLP